MSSSQTTGRPLDHQNSRSDKALLLTEANVKAYDRQLDRANENNNAGVATVSSIPD